MEIGIKTGADIIFASLLVSVTISVIVLISVIIYQKCSLRRMRSQRLDSLTESTRSQVTNYSATYNNHSLRNLALNSPTVYTSSDNPIVRQSSQGYMEDGMTYGVAITRRDQITLHALAPPLPTRP